MCSDERKTLVFCAYSQGSSEGRTGTEILSKSNPVDDVYSYLPDIVDMLRKTKRVSNSYNITRDYWTFPREQWTHSEVLEHNRRHNNFLYERKVVVGNVM